MKRRSSWFVLGASSLLLLSCSTPQPAPNTASTHKSVTLAAEKPAKPLDEPLEPPVVTTDVAKAPDAPEALVAGPDEPLTAPVETHWGSAPKALDAAGSAWGSGGLGLSGVGEGGGGRGEGIGLGSVGTVGRGAGTGTGSGFGSGHGRLGGSHAAAGPVRVGGVVGAVRVGGSSAGAASQLPSGVRTGEWDDNANFREYGRWLATEKGRGASSIDVSVRRFLVVRDAAGKPVPSCNVEVRDASGKTTTFTTTSTGRALLFPRAEGFRSQDLTATANCQGAKVAQSFRAAAGDGIVDLSLPSNRVLPDAQTIDVAFVLDTTGSMSEEINALRDTLEKVASSLGTVGIRPRVGLVEYRDRGDAFVTRMHQMTTDVAGLQARIAALQANGGGDTPEHVNEAVRVAVRTLKFKPESIARLVFLVGDAPPHLDYANDEGYVGAMQEANHAGIQIYSIAASGMDALGQVVFRQLAQYTGGTHMFVLRGGAGPQSTGGGDPRSSCGGTHTDYTSGNLDALILSKVRSAIASKDVSPLRIAGLHQDEKDRPCDQRVGMVQ
ncbi:MAG: VWA domain-containing protein [Polyangiaceae bacterium]|nr:VWA domain-containing protein [Polyangiaceae bacterium]